MEISNSLVLDSYKTYCNIIDLIKLNSDIFDSKVEISEWYKIFGINFKCFNEEEILDIDISEQIIKILKDDIDNFEETRRSFRISSSSNDNYEVLIEKDTSFDNENPIYNICKIYLDEEIEKSRVFYFDVQPKFFNKDNVINLFKDDELLEVRKSIKNIDELSHLWLQDILNLTKYKLNQKKFIFEILQESTLINNDLKLVNRNDKSLNFEDETIHNKNLFYKEF